MRRLHPEMDTIGTFLGPRAIPSKVWQNEELFFRGDAYFSELERGLDRAKTSIDFETYIFEDDVLGKKICAALQRASMRGVAVRLLVDGVGASNWIQTASRSLLESMVEVRVFHPLPWLLLPHAFWNISVLAKAYGFLVKANRRNHRKVCLIDHAHAFVGSLNVSSCHIESYAQSESWRDTGAHVVGDTVKEFERAFEIAWTESWRITQDWLRPPALFRKRPSVVGSGLVRLNHTRTLRKAGYNRLLDLLLRARKRIWITNAYFVPPGSLLRTLAACAQQGTDVRILVPAKSDVFFMPWVAAAFYYALLKAGVRLYEYLPRVLHAKTILLDQLAFVGSSNLNQRSYKHDLEADVVLRFEHSLQNLEDAFLADLTFAREITIKEWQDKPWWQKLLGRIALLLRYWL